MKATKYCTVTQNNNHKSFGLFYCKAQKKDGVLIVSKILERIEIGNNPKALAEQGQSMGLIVVQAPSPGSIYIMRGAKQPNGDILDPLVDWEGNLIENCRRSRGTIARALELSENKTALR